jgi:serine/threonine-protein kinase
MADGLGGHGNGDVASRKAVEVALKIFREANISTQPRALLAEIFKSANETLHEENVKRSSGMPMATTLTVCIFRDKALAVGHVGDTRVYLVRAGQAERLTHDHSQTGWQMKLRLITEHEARDSRQRSMLTRSVGTEPMVRFDFKSLPLLQHDRVVQCTDGLYCFMNRGEIAEGVDRLAMREICPYLVGLSERRNSDDNISVQVVEVGKLEEPRVNRPLSILKATHVEGDPPPASHEVRPGQVLDNRFEILEVIGRSGMASVFKAKDRETGETVAVKVPYMQFESDPAFFSRFQREAEIGKKLNHPNILRFIDVPNQSRPYIVTEFLEGKTLADLLSEVRPFPLQDAVQIASLLCDALQHMHEKKIVHRDMKPQNVMVLNDGTLRIMDFGIAKSLEARRLTFAGFTSTMGTPDYMSPEQVKSKRGDARTDIYSLGAMLYEMTTGAVPFEGPNPFIVMNSRVTGDPIAPRKRNPEIPPELEEVILHAMERDPRQRYESAAAMKKDLDDPGQVILVGRHHHLKRPNLWKTRWRGARIYVYSGLVPILLFGTMLVVSRCNHAKKGRLEPAPETKETVHGKGTGHR